MRRLLEYDHHRGLRIDYVGNGDGTYTLDYQQDVEPLLDLNKALQNEGRQAYAKDPDMWHVASIPIVVQYEWAKRFGIPDVTLPEYQDLIVKLLNNPEWAYLKRAPITI